MSLPSVSAFSMLEKHTQSTQSDSGGFVIIGRVWQIPGAIQPASPASVAHALRSAAGPGIGQGTDDDAPETILEPFRSTGSTWPVPRRSRDHRAPWLPAIVRGPPSHFAAVGGSPPFGCASGGGRLATHPAAALDPSPPRRQAADRPAPRRTASADHASPAWRASLPARAAVTAPRRDGEGVQDSRVLRLPDPSPPFQFLPPSPPPPACRRSRPRAAGSDFPPMRIIVGGRTRKEGTDGYIYA